MLLILTLKNKNIFINNLIFFKWKLWILLSKYDEIEKNNNWNINDKKVFNNNFTIELLVYQLTKKICFFNKIIAWFPYLLQYLYHVHMTFDIFTFKNKKIKEISRKYLTQFYASFYVYKFIINFVFK